MVPDTDVDVARELIAGSLTTFARFSVMHGSVQGPADDAQREVFEGVYSSYDMKHHTRTGSSQTKGLTPEFIDHKRAELLDKLEGLRAREAALPGMITATEDFVDHHPNPGPVDSARQTLKGYREELDELPALQARTRAHYKRIVAALADNLRKYEEQFGEVEDPGDAPRPEDIGFVH